MVYCDPEEYKIDLIAIAASGPNRLRQTVEVHMQWKHQDERVAATDKMQKAVIERKSQHEVEEVVKGVTFPYYLWGSV